MKTNSHQSSHQTILVSLLMGNRLIAGFADNPDETAHQHIAQAPNHDTTGEGRTYVRVGSDGVSRPYFYLIDVNRVSHLRTFCGRRRNNARNT
jgi:hypothetical protein